jgi:hypothetical protein
MRLTPVILGTSIAMFLAIATFGNPQLGHHQGLRVLQSSLVGFPNADKFALLGVGEGHRPGDRSAKKPLAL